MKRILLTGTNGLLGQKLFFLLSDLEEIELIGTGRGPARIDYQGVKYFDVDLTDKKALYSKVLKLAPTHIIHTAAMTQVDLCETNQEQCWLNNVVASENLIGLAKDIDAYFQYISTDFVFDGTEGPYLEDDIPNPVNFYGKSKLAVEHILAKSGLVFSIVRTVLVYGVSKDLSRSNIVLWTKNKLESGERIRVVDDQWRSPTLVEDLALGCKLILDEAANGIFHISGKDYLTAYNVAMKTAEVFGLDKDLISPTNASEFKEVAIRPLKTGFDISKARKQLGFEPVSLTEGLRMVKRQLFNLEKTRSQ